MGNIARSVIDCELKDPKLVPSGKIIEIFGFGNPSTLQTYLGFHLTDNQ